MNHPPHGSGSSEPTHETEKERPQSLTRVGTGRDRRRLHHVPQEGPRPPDPTPVLRDLLKLMEIGLKPVRDLARPLPN